MTKVTSLRSEQVCDLRAAMAPTLFCEEVARQLYRETGVMPFELFIEMFRTPAETIRQVQQRRTFGCCEEKVGCV